MNNNFNWWIDGTIIIIYLCVLTGIGVYFSKQQKSLGDYVKGSGSLGWFMIGMSLMAALNSGLDYIQAPAAVFVFGMVFVMQILSWIPLYPYVSRITLRFYRKLDIYSVYEYLEQRYGLTLRLVGSGLYILWRTGWMGAALYVPCLAVQGATGNQLNITWMIIVLGSVVTIYTMLGGMRAVIWTDVIQFCIMFTGVAATLWFIRSHIPGGFAEIFDLAHKAEMVDFQAEIPGFAEAGLWEKIHLYFTTEVTLIGMVAMVLLSRMTGFTADQVAVQRMQTSQNLPYARKSLLVMAVADWIWMLVLGVVGLALYSFYQYEVLPGGMQNDQILPYFIATMFPVGLTGLVIAAIFAASLSSVDAAINANTSVFMVDFYNRLVLGRQQPLKNPSPEESRRQLFVSRLANLGIGILMILISVNVGRLGEIYQSANKILGAFFGPLFGIFVLGMFTRRAHSRGVAIGIVAGLITSFYISFFSSLSWQWPSPFGIVVTLVVGYLGSLLIPKSRREANRKPLTFREVMSTEEGRS